MRGGIAAPWFASIQRLALQLPPRGQWGGYLRRAGGSRTGSAHAASQRFLEAERIPAESDGDLAKRARVGDAKAFGVLVERYAPMVRRLTRAVLRHAADADDAAQDAFVAVWTSLPRFDPAQPFAPWLARIALNAARDLARRRRVRQTEAVPETLASSVPGPEQDAERRLLGRRLDAALTALPERQRLAVVLYDVEGYRHAEIAALLDVPEGTVRSEVFHGRRHLRASLAKSEGAR